MKKLSLLILLLLLPMVIACSGEDKPTKSTVKVESITDTHTRYNKGDPNALVEVIEYSDFACPSCISYHKEDVYGWLKGQFGEDMTFQYRHYAAISPYSPLAGQGVECAGEQGRFWKYHDILMERADVSALDAASLDRYATLSGVDLVAFKQCMTEGKYSNLVSADTGEIRSMITEAGVTGSTPTFVVNGKIAPNDVTELKEFIEAEIAAAQ